MQSNTFILAVIVTSSLIFSSCFGSESKDSNTNAAPQKPKATMGTAGALLGLDPKAPVQDEETKADTTNQLALFQTALKEAGFNAGIGFGVSAGAINCVSIPYTNRAGVELKLSIVIVNGIQQNTAELWAKNTKAQADALLPVLAKISPALQKKAKEVINTFTTSSNKTEVEIEGYALRTASDAIELQPLPKTFSWR